jgi:hypothetical protein
MPIVYCPMCQQGTTAPESDRTRTIPCPDCGYYFKVEPALEEAAEIIAEAPPASAPKRQMPNAAPLIEEALEVVEDEPPDPAPAPRRKQPASAPAPRRQSTPPPRRAEAPTPVPEPTAPLISAASPFDFDGAASGGEGPLVQNQGERLRRQGRQAMGGWLLLAAVLDSLPIVGAIIMALVVAFAPRVPPDVAGGGMIGAVVFSVIGLVLVLPIMLGAWSMSRSRSFGLSLTGAIFALVLGLLYGLFIVPSVLAILARNGGVAGVCFGLAVIGLISCVSGLMSIINLFRYASRSDSRSRQDDPEEDERPRRRRRRDEDEDDRPAPRRRAGRGRDDY